MSRGKQAPKRVTVPDPVYNSDLVAKFVNFVMMDGKKTVAQRAVYGAFDIVKEKIDEEEKATQDYIFSRGTSLNHDPN